MRINLLPESYRPQPQVRFLNLIILLVGVVAILTVSLFGYLAYKENQSLTAESDKLAMTIQSFQGILAEARQKEALFAEVEKLHEEILKVQVLYQDHADIFRKIANEMPGDIWLSDLKIGSKGSITMNGATLIFPQLSEFLSNINQLNIFKKARFISISQKEGVDNVLYKFLLELETGRDSLEYK